jgi:hypothetical protein
VTLPIRPIPDVKFIVDPKAPTLPEDPDPLKYVKKIIDVVPLIPGGGGGGGGSGTGTGTFPGGTVPGKVPDVFKTDTLPTGDDIPAFGGGTRRRPKDVSGTDWKTYGFRPGINFFEPVPAAAMAATPQVPGGGLIPPPAGSINTQAFVDWVNDKTGEKRSVSSGGYSAAPGSGWRTAAKGGSMAVRRPSKSFAVQGAGDGRSDDIPAVLSDGEYVMDAETVALLGNGSNKAGAAQLDRFRANVRKHKGKELAKGRFSVNAKAPHAYFKGGA